MDDQRIRFNHAYRVERQSAALFAQDLRRAKVRQQRDIGSDTAQIARQAKVVFAFQRHALRAYPERQAKRLRRLGEMVIDRARTRCAAGHRTDKKRGLHAAVEQTGAQIDLIQMQLRQGAVGEMPAGEAARCRRGVTQNNVQMIVFAFRQVRVLHCCSIYSDGKRAVSRP